MSPLSIAILHFISNQKKQTDIDAIQSNFKAYSPKEIIEAIDPLCGSKAKNGHITYRKPTRNDLPNIDRIRITEKGRSFLVKKM